MPLPTLAMKQTLKSHIQANSTAIDYSGGNAAISVVFAQEPLGSGDAQLISEWYNLFASPSYWAWQTAVNRQSIYHSTSDLPSVFDWQTFKAQNVTEQNAWVQMFMGDVAPFNRINLREGVFRIFSGTAAQNAQRAHIFAMARRLVRNVEKVFTVAVAVEGGIDPDVDNGNVLASALGSTANPALMNFQGTVSGNDISDLKGIS